MSADHFLCKRLTMKQITWLPSPKSKAQTLRCCCMHSILLQILIFCVTLGLPYKFPFYVHILYIRYGTVLANTAVLCMHVHIVYLLVHGSAPWWVLLQHSVMLRLFFIVESGITRFLCAMRVFEVQASSSSPRLPLCEISFRLWPPLLS